MPVPELLKHLTQHLKEEFTLKKKKKSQYVLTYNVISNLHVIYFCGKKKRTVSS